MKRRKIVVLAVAVALAFAGSVGPRHAWAAAQNHGHAATAEAGPSHKHDEAGGKHSHDHDAAASSYSNSHAMDAPHDHVGGQPASDQGCCYAWCNSAAIIHAADGLLIHTAHDEHFASERPIRIVAFSAAIDPPPR